MLFYLQNFIKGSSFNIFKFFYNIKLLFLQILKTYDFSRSPSDNYGRLTVPPNYWVAFKGLCDENLIMNFSNLLHDPAEAINESYDSGRFAMIL